MQLKSDKAKLSKYFSALSNNIRLNIFVEILHEACECKLEGNDTVWGNCVTKIAEQLNLPQPSVSNHVKELINAGLVTTVKKGQRTYLFGNKEIISEFSDLTNFINLEINGHE